MSTKTANYELFKPELSDPADITAMNINWDKIDTLLKYLENNVSIPKITQVTIPAARWNTSYLTATVEVTGILSDITKQLVHTVPDANSMEAAIEAGVYCSGQSTNKLTFMCKTVPTVDIVFNVSYQNAVPG